jgi:20S proteasome alpha/beta subunit
MDKRKQTFALFGDSSDTEFVLTEFPQIIGVESDDGLVICSVHTDGHPLKVESNNGLISKINDSIFTGITGATASRSQFLRLMNDKAVDEIIEYGQELTVDDLVSDIVGYISQEKNNSVDDVFGCLVAGYSNSEPQLYRVLSDGTNDRYKAVSIGHNSQDSMVMLEDMYTDNLSTASAKELCLNIIEQQYNTESMKSSVAVQIGVISDETEEVDIYTRGES